MKAFLIVGIISREWKVADLPSRAYLLPDVFEEVATTSAHLTVWHVCAETDFSTLRVPSHNPAKSAST